MRNLQITKIYFDANGRPSWKTLDTAKFIHTMDEYKGPPIQYTDDDVAWFRKPLTEERSK